VSKDCRVAFDTTQPDNAWQLLRETPEKYIYGSMRHGVIDEHLNVLPMPEQLVAGEHNIAQRQNWNQRATEPYALPTETWREYFHRRNRTLELRQRLADGEIHEVDDLITWNLDIRQFAQDVVEHVGGVDLIRAFWKEIRDITILDPTVGSGAFLFAAVKVVEPLYSGLLERMEVEVERASSRALGDFREVLDEGARHPNLEYFVLRQIILNNLYGVDIEEEAVEICKLRLFLLLAAKLEEGKQIEPLPDIDFNIRAGNTLVGYATRDEVTRAAGTGQMTLDLGNTVGRIDEAVELADKAFQHFKEIQTDEHEHRADLPGAKRDYQERLDSLRDELDGYLYKQQGAKDGMASWRARTHPFHWFAEFHSIVIGNGGFDVIIGNPPYVEVSKVTGYTVPNTYKTKSCGNLYANVLERCDQIRCQSASSGFIVPLSIVSTSRMAPLRSALFGEGRGHWLSCFDVYPTKLFAEAKQRLTIIVSKAKQIQSLHSTKYLRWWPQERNHLFECISYNGTVEQPSVGAVPKIGSSVELSIFQKLHSKRPVSFQPKADPIESIYIHRIPYNYVKALDRYPYYRSDIKGEGRSADYKPYTAVVRHHHLPIIATVNSSLFFWHWYLLYEGYHCGRGEIVTFPFGFDDADLSTMKTLEGVGALLVEDLHSNARRKTALYKNTGSVTYDEYYPRRSKHFADQVDLILSDYYGFTDEELNFVVNFDIKYRADQD